MKKIILLVLLFTALSIASIVNLFSLSDTYLINDLSNKNFEFKSIFERKFSNDVDSLFKHNFVVNSTDSKYNSNNEYFYLSLLPSPGAPYGFSGPYIPEIIYVDENENIYISDHINGLKVYNKNGYYETKFDYPQYFEFNKSFIDEENNLIIDLVSNYYFNLNNKLTYKSYFIDSESLNLIDYTHSESSKICENYLYGQEVIDNSTIKNNRISFHGIIMDISNKDNGRFVYPSNISLYKFKNDDEHLKFMNFRIPHEYIYDIQKENILYDINITDYSDKKIIYVASSYLSNKGDLYLLGIHSNDIQTISNFEKRVNNPTLFLWKFENKN